jgi:RNA polymerase sigma-70 factor (ECF subfamily)
MSSEVATYFPHAITQPAESEEHRRISSPEVDLVGQVLHEENFIERAAVGHLDEDLINQVSNGSKEALALLFRRHAQSVFNVASRILRDEAEAEDLLQELFLFVFQKANLFDRTKSTAVSWIIQMTYHRAIDRRRYLHARRHYDVQEFVEERQQPTALQTSIDEITARSLLATLRDELAPDQLQTLELHFFEGYTFHEIAEKTGQTLGNVRHHHYRGLERLRSFVFPKKRD